MLPMADTGSDSRRDVPRGRRRSRLWLAAVALIAMPMIVSWWLRQPDRDNPCHKVAGPARLADLPEASGLAVSRRTPGILWSHNDSGHDTTLFAIDATGVVRGRVRVPVETRDWEDISSARCPDGTCLLIADIGDNRHVRDSLPIYRVPEPAVDDAETARPERFEARYDDGPHNAEALFVLESGLFIVTRDREGALYRASLPETDGAVTFHRTGRLGLEAVTDAETARDGETVVVRTSHEAVIYASADLVRGVTTPRLRIPIDWLRESQGEGVALDGRMLYLASEGGAFSGDGRLLTLECALPAVSSPSPAPRGPSSSG
jgi:hypothetical protein